ncbi:MAG: YraN family protein [Kordiimonadaceae bacterium]|jgi:putative endonuclease|nr:YraN family protein [Kordiimonadaceae bacterium]MBT6033703.1 YraN family protein [Kordiimonadaceae bacterium]
MTKTDKIKAYKLGHFAENIAVAVLFLKGYSILHKRYRSPFGEIDLIAKRGDTTVFCEVKARKDYTTAIHSLSVHQQKRISKSAEYYMSHLKSGNDNNKIDTQIYRCDMVLIIPWRWPVHIKNAW